MMQSMTGFGRTISENNGIKITIDIKTLNSKNLDLNVKLPIRYKEIELEIRKIISEKLIRGKADCFITYENLNEYRNNKINKDAVKSYINDLEKINPNINLNESIAIAMRLPDVLVSIDEDINPEEFINIKENLINTLNKVIEFRKIEGNTIQKEIINNINEIEQSLTLIPDFEQERIQKIKQKFQLYIDELNVNVDENRFHQEIAFYIEKLDISEEKTRLKQHLEYFKETSKVINSGKKLGFISQEIGREINTLGSKANHYEIQKIIVSMKDNLEKIKEQILNII